MEDLITQYAPHFGILLFGFIVYVVCFGTFGGWKDLATSFKTEQTIKSEKEMGDCKTQLTLNKSSMKPVTAIPTGDGLYLSFLRRPKLMIPWEKFENLQSKTTKILSMEVIEYSATIQTLEKDVLIKIPHHVIHFARDHKKLEILE